MLTVVVADAALELVPKELAGHPSVASHARNRRKKPTELLLDSSLHWRAMAKLENKARRGRPDIIHDLLKLALDSQLNKQGKLRVFIHTIDNKTILVNPKTRLPRNYSQFVGLMEDLYRKKGIEAGGTKLLSLEEKSLAELLEELGCEPVVFDARGKPFSLKQLADFFKRKEETVVVIGGFPHGSFLSERALAGLQRVSVSSIELTAPAVLAKAISAYELGAGF